MRTILTFSTLHRVLAAEKRLRNNDSTKTAVRPTPTPPGLSSAICGMSLEILEKDKEQQVIDCLTRGKLVPEGVYNV
ncbi:MAG: DUF3343 domain-containing protein [Candidatus Melainabacteria bacterium]|nr:DUF3343 domain-containing protein [Candidatus Melainabacteria bacterium]